MSASCIYVVIAFSLMNNVLAASTSVYDNTSIRSDSNSPKNTDITRECEFAPVDQKIRDDLNEALETDLKLIQFHISFKDYPNETLNLTGGDIFRPTVWMRATNRQGLSLLKLDDNFEVLSLSLLGIGVTNMNVKLVETTLGCMSNMTSSQRVSKIRHLLLNDFKNAKPGEDTGSLSKQERICNMKMVKSNEHAIFVHHCCHTDPDGIEICENIERDVWINALLVCVVIIKVLVILYSPSFIPEGMYRENAKATKYIHKFPEGKRKMRVTVIKPKNPGKYNRKGLVDLNNLERLLAYFKKSLNQMQLGVKYEADLDCIHLSAKTRKLLPEDDVPVSILKLLYENVFRCQMRKIPVLKSCCEMDVYHNVTLYKCLRIVARLVLLGLLAIPWILRLIVYFQYEALTVHRKIAAAEKHNLHIHFNGSFTLYLTPLHALFIAIYTIVTIDSVSYGLFSKSVKKNRFNLILRKCLRDTREESRLDAYNWAVEVCLFPFRRYRLIGFVMAPLFWLLIIPCILPILAFYTFPTVNLSVRLIIHLVIFSCPNRVADWCNMKFQSISENLRVSNTEANGKETIVKDFLKLRGIGEKFQGKKDLPKKEVCVHLMIIIVCLISFWSLTFLLMECLSFFVEVGVYTLMGIIVNSGATLQYISLLFLVSIYAYKSFHCVSEKYLNYHKIIRGLLLKRKQEAIKRANTNDNMLFQVESEQTTGGTKSCIGIDVKDGKIRWITKGLLVFLNEEDKIFTPRKFFTETIALDYCGCPGKVWRNTLSAFYNFMKMFFFLVFVAIVVLAFGNKLSTTNQTLATLAGGFVPLIVSTFFQKGEESSKEDKETIEASVVFQKEFDKAIANFEEKWRVADMKSVSEFQPSNELTDDVDLGNEENGNIPDFREPLLPENDVRFFIDVNHDAPESNKLDFIITCVDRKGIWRNGL